MDSIDLNKLARKANSMKCNIHNAAAEANVVSGKLEFKTCCEEFQKKVIAATQKEAGAQVMESAKAQIAKALTKNGVFRLKK